MKITILLFLLLPVLASAQYFDVFDIDTSEYPIMKAKFYSTNANGKQILNHTPADFEITENGEPRDVISVSCSYNEPEPISLVIAIDLSGSMDDENLKMAIDATKTLVNWLPNNGSECAIIGFNDENRIIQDFTTNKSKLLKYIDNINAFGGTEFNAAFIDPTFSALKMMESAKFNSKSILLITDGYADGSQGNIITQSKALNTTINSISLFSPSPMILKEITEQTNGKHFENIDEIEEIKEIASSISLNLFTKPCEVVWRSEIQCNNIVNVSFKLNNITKSDRYSLSKEQLGRLEVSPNFINFGNVSLNNTKDTFITLTSYNADIILNDIIINNNSGNFEIKTQLPIVIKKGTPQKINISFSSTDNFRYFSIADLITDKCTQEFSLYGGNKNNPLKLTTLEIISPNGGEVYGVGIDTLINWKGVPYEEIISLEYSHDSGVNWNLITTEASKLQHVWTTPNIVSDNYLIRASQGVSSDLKEGEIVWEKSIGDSSLQGAYSIKQTSDGGYMVVGTNTESLTSNNIYDFYVVKIDAFGKVEWDKELISPRQDFAYSVIEASDGGFVVVGEIGDASGFHNDLLILKLDFNGETEWEKRYGSNHSDSAYDIVETEDNEFLIVGVIREGSRDVSKSFGREDIWLIKLDSKGSLVWQNTIGGKGSDYPNEIKATQDGGYIIAGGSSSTDNGFGKNKGDTDSWIFKLDKDGNLQWQKNYGDEIKNGSSAIIQTIDGGYLLTGNSKINYLDEIKYYTVYKLDESGEIEWEIKKEENKSTEGVIETIEGNYIIAGNSKVDYWVMKLSSAGEIIYERTYGGSERDLLKSIDNTLDGGYILAGIGNSTDGDVSESKESSDMWVVKIAGPPKILQSDTSDAVFSIIMPEPVIQNNDIDMGQMIVGNTKDTIVSSVICNVGDAPLHVLGVDITDAFDSEDFLIPRGAGDFYLEKDSCQDMMFEFTPSALGNRTAVATIRTTIGDFQDTIHIRGVGINPIIEATAEVVDFGVFELGKGKDTNVVLVKNVGSTDITITDTRISGPDMEQFTLKTSPVNYAIPAGEEEEFELNYTAKYGGRTSSILEFHYNGIGSPLRSMLFAEGFGGEVYPQVKDAFVGETVQLELFLGKIKPEGLSEVATNYSATVSYNSALLAPIDKSINVSTENGLSFIRITGQLSQVPQIAAVPMKVGLGTADRSGLVITEFQLYDANGDSVDYDIEPGVGEFNVLGICEEGGQRLLNPNGDVTLLKLLPNRTLNQTIVEMTLIESGQTELTIFDQIGNKVETVYSGNPEIGRQEIILDLSQYTNGRYYIKLTTPTITKTEILEVVR